MNVFRYVLLSCCAVVDLGLLVFGVMGLAVFASDPEPSVPMAMIAAWTLGAFAMLCLTGWSFYRTAKEKKNPVLYGLFWKGVVLLMVLAVSWFALDIPEAGWIALVFAAVLAALLIALPKISTNTTGAFSKRGVSRTIEMPEFTFDKAEWAWDDVATEYLRLQGIVYDMRDREQYEAYKERIGAMGESETDRIYDYAGTPIAFFLGWLIQRDLVSGEFLSLHDPELVRGIKEQTRTPLEVLRNMDYVLSREDIDPGARQFMNYYYEMENAGGGAFKYSTPKYFFDYYGTICSNFDIPRYYCVDFTWDRFHALARVLDRRYREFYARGIDESELVTGEGRLRTQYFDTEAELVYEPGTPEQYVSLCAEAYENMNGRLRADLSAAMLELCTEEIADEDTVPEKILPRLHPEKVAVMNPQIVEGSDEGGSIAKVPAFVILGECDWEPEHGTAFTVIGSYVVNTAYYADAESPWTEERMWTYKRRRDISTRNMRTVQLIPPQFGGSAGQGIGGSAGQSIGGAAGQSADADPHIQENQLTVPAACAQRKEEIDRMIEALYMLKLAEKYDCKLTYDGDEPNYMFVSAIKGDRRSFADSIRLKD